MNYKRLISVMLIVAVALAAVFANGNSEAASSEASEVKYPTKTINITVPYDAGSSTDIRARMLAQKLSDSLGQPVTITNLKGAAGSIGTIDYFNKKADPHEILIVGIAAMTTGPLTNSKLPYRFSDFKVIAALDQEQQILYVCPEKSGIHSWEELVAKGRERTVKYGGGGPTAANDIIQAAAYKKSGMKYESIVTSSTSQRIIDVLAGTTDVTVAPPASGAEFVKNGQLIPIAVLSHENYKGFEGFDVPSLESKGFENYVFNAYNMILMNGKVEDAYIKVLQDAISKIYQDPEYTAKAQEMGMNICYDSSADVQKNVDGTVEAFARMLQEIK